MIFKGFFFGAAAAIGTMFGVWVIERDPPVVTNSSEVLTQTVPPGGVLRIHNRVTRFRQCQTHIDRLLLDSAKVRSELSDVDAERPLGPMGEDEFTIEVKIPSTFSNGPAIYRTITAYRCNLIHKWFWPIVLGPVDIIFEVRGVAPAPNPPPEYAPTFPP